MNENWKAFERILCIRADNMGDLIMSGPAIRALKETFGARITVLTSSMATPVAEHMEAIDEVITFDFPWVKSDHAETPESYRQLIETIGAGNFDAAVVFTVYSQNPLPAVMLAYLAGIPNRLAYCRENPYQLLTHWVPDPEPYTYIRHQVRRDLDLVAHIGASTADEALHLRTNHQLWDQIENKLQLAGVDPGKKWLILHAGVSEAKRQFPVARWVEAAQQLIRDFDYQVLLTGAAADQPLTGQLQHKIGGQAFSTSGLFNIEELITLISRAPVILTVNTGTVHIAAAVGTPVVVLYALTNPQHTPWKVPCRILPFKVKLNLHSKNEVIKHVNQFFYKEIIGNPNAAHITNAVNELLADPGEYLNQELYLIELMQERVSFT